jgi:hypothetical protein
MVIELGIIGGAFGVAGAFIGGGALGDVSFGGLGLAIIGYLIGYFLGIIIGIVVIKKVFHQPGSLLLGVLGSIIGFVVAILITVTLVSDATLATVFAILFIVSPVFCVAGFHLKRPVSVSQES